MLPNFSDQIRIISNQYILNQLFEMRDRQYNEQSINRKRNTPRQQGQKHKLKNDSQMKDYQLSNFIVQSKKFLHDLPQINLNQRTKNKTEEEKTVKSLNQYKLNGVNYFVNRKVLGENAQVLEDCCSVRGDTFYLKRGQVVEITAIVSSQYAQVHFRGFSGYFLTSFFKTRSNIY